MSKSRPLPYQRSVLPSELTSHFQRRYSPLYSLQNPQMPHFPFWYSTRFVGQGLEPPHRIELRSKHYKCLVLAFVLWWHMEARVDHDSTPVDYETTILPTYTISPNGAGWRYRSSLDSHPTSRQQCGALPLGQSGIWRRVKDSNPHRLSPTHGFQGQGLTIRLTRHFFIMYILSHNFLQKSNFTF